MVELLTLIVKEIAKFHLGVNDNKGTIPPSIFCLYILVKNPKQVQNCPVTEWQTAAQFLIPVNCLTSQLVNSKFKSLIPYCFLLSESQGSRLRQNIYMTEAELTYFGTKVKFGLKPFDFSLYKEFYLVIEIKIKPSKDSVKSV
jgi:hypothetical protein